MPIINVFKVWYFFISDHIGNLTVELILASAEVIFKNRKILSAMEVASSYKLISLLKTAFNAYNAYNAFTALKSNTAFFACTA